MNRTMEDTQLAMEVIKARGPGDGVCYIFKEESVCIARGTEGDPP